MQSVGLALSDVFRMLQFGATISQIALAWLLTLSPVTLAIPGTGSLAHLEENIEAGSITLSPDDRADLDMTTGQQVEVEKKLGESSWIK